MAATIRTSDQSLTGRMGSLYERSSPPNTMQVTQMLRAGTSDIINKLAPFYFEPASYNFYVHHLEYLSDLTKALKISRDSPYIERHIRLAFESGFRALLQASSEEELVVLAEKLLEVRRSSLERMWSDPRTLAFVKRNALKSVNEFDKAKLEEIIPSEVIEESRKRELEEGGKVLAEFVLQKASQSLENKTKMVDSEEIRAAIMGRRPISLSAP